MSTERTATLEHAVEIVAAADAHGVITRIMGGVGIALHCPSSERDPFLRHYSDLDLIVDRRGARKHVDRVFEHLDYEPNVEFNTINGPEGRRQYHSGDGRKVDVFVGTFRMCHELSLEPRLTSDAPTVTLADLFLTKAQIVEMTSKDTLDLACLLLDHELADHDEDCINRSHLADVTGGDWGLWRTVSNSLQNLRTAVERLELDPDDASVIKARVDELQSALDAAPKSTKWKLRARVGERKRWYELPEDPERGPAA